MLKKILMVLAVLAVLVVAAVFGLRYIAGPSNGASMLPAGTVFYASLNDIPRSALRWQGSALAQIGREPEVRAFLEKPLARLEADAGAGEAGGILSALKPTQIFVAATGVSARRSDFVVGFQYWGGKSDFDAAVARLRKELPPGAESRESHAGDEIVVTAHGAFVLGSATHGRWGFLSTDQAALRALLDRVAGRGSGPVLADAPEYRTSTERTLPAPDVTFFLRPPKIVDAVIEAGASQGAEAIPEQVRELRATEAVAGAWKLDGATQRDAVFLLRPGTAPAEAAARKAIRFTTADSVLFVNFLARSDGLAPLLRSTLPRGGDAIAALAESSAGSFGPEGAIIADWKTGQATPAALVALEIRDPAGAADAIAKLTAFFPETLISERDGVRLFSIPSVSNPFASPTLALAGDFLIAGLDPAAVARAAGTTGPTLEAQPSFAPALALYRSSDELFAFVDSRAVFERAYNALRPVILFGAQLMPGVSQTIDTTKLPQTETIARHLPPITLSEKRFTDGLRVESAGPFGVSQLALGLAAAAAVGSHGGR
jgi:hypothetical protein